MPFDKNLYHKEYCKKNYIEKKVRLKPDFWLEIDDFCHWNSMSFNSLAVSAIKKYLDEEHIINAEK